MTSNYTLRYEELQAIEHALKQITPQNATLPTRNFGRSALETIRSVMDDHSSMSRFNIKEVD